MANLNKRFWRGGGPADTPVRLEGGSLDSRTCYVFPGQEFIKNFTPATIEKYTETDRHDESGLPIWDCSELKQ